jgi:predicted PolB exonuclease-like 3'-5' exonuclease
MRRDYRGEGEFGRSQRRKWNEILSKYSVRHCQRISKNIINKMYWILHISLLIIINRKVVRRPRKYLQ